MRGAIAERHLLAYLTDLQPTGAIEGFEEFDRDAYPDYRIDYQGKSHLLEVKNVRQKQTKQPDEPIRVEEQRTRVPIGHPELHYYLPTDGHALEVVGFKERFVAPEHLRDKL